MGRDRFERLLKQRPAKKLTDGDHLLYHHALRCLCQRCGRLLDWDCPEDLSYTITECCGMEYRLMPWTVKAEVKDISCRPVLPKMKGSDYSDPNVDLSKQLIGELNTIETITAKPLSAAQGGLGGAFPEPSETIQEPRTIIIPPDDLGLQLDVDDTGDEEGGGGAGGLHEPDA